jgi:CBS domain-containing protein
MTSNPCAIDADKSVAYAAKMMKDEDVGVAERRDPGTTPVRDVAQTNVVTVAPDQDLDEALQPMASHQVRRLPVVEEDRMLVGVVAQADVAQQAKPKKVGELVEEIAE